MSARTTALTLVLCCWVLLDPAVTISRISCKRFLTATEKQMFFFCFIHAMLVQNNSCSGPYAGGIWKRSFISTVRRTLHTFPTRKRSFSETPFKPAEFENARFSFLCRWRTFAKEAFVDDVVTIVMWFPWLVIVAFLNSSDVVWTENIWCVFRAKPRFSNSSGAVWTGLESHRHLLCHASKKQESAMTKSLVIFVMIFRIEHTFSWSKFLNR